MTRAAEKLRRLMRGDDARWVLLKGGHLPGGEAIDLLHDGDRMIELTAERVATRNTHGPAALCPQPWPRCCHKAKTCQPPRDAPSSI